MATSLFTTTLAISFLVVAAPHLLPCPVPRRSLADSADPEALTDPKKRRQRKIQAVAEGETANSAETAV
jgi:cytochrome c oxidase assembly factor 2